MWHVLKMRQEKSHKDLEHVAMKFPASYNHIWITLFTVDSDSRLVITQLDPTHADVFPDTDLKNQPPAKIFIEALSGDSDGSFATLPDRAQCLTNHWVSGIYPTQNTEKNFQLIMEVCWGLGLCNRMEDAVELLKYYLETLSFTDRTSYISWVRKICDDGGNPGYWWAQENATLAKKYLLPMLEQF